ncbi:MAG: hypothetical protein M1812_006339 [Candelaria pacifica]|nr:MAG: hypothetical protein M1812_006339 [Candelaria pacifica]
MYNDWIARLAAIYDARSSTYDTTFHPVLARDILQFTNPQTGFSVLDLACGTGLVVLQAKSLVGPSGSVVGIDISEGMMDVGRESLRHWDHYLAPKGRIVFDVMVEEANVGAAILEKIADESGLAKDL